MDFTNKYPNFAHCSIQTFDDNGQRADRSLARIFAFEEKEKLIELQNKGAGVFFSVNQMEYGKRNAESVIGINAWICEIDNKSKEEQQKLIKSCPLMPSCIVESNKSYHLYRFAKDGTKENRKDICHGICDYFGGDPKVIDIARVLRLPGYKHLKDFNSPFEIKCIYLKENYYTEKEMQENYKYEPPKQEIAEKRFEIDNGPLQEIYWMNAKEILSYLSGTSLINGDSIDFKSNSNGTEQIWINGKSSSCWIDKSGYIGSSDKGGPSRVSRISWYYPGTSKSFIYKRAKEQFPHKFEKKKFEKKPAKIITDIKKGIDYNGKYYTRGLDCLDNRFGKFSNRDFVLLVGYSSMGKTEFGFFTARANCKTEKVAYFCIEINEHDMKQRLCRSRAGVKKIDFQNNNFSDYQKQLMDDHYKYLDSFNIKFISFTEQPTIEVIIETMDKLRQEGYTLFYIDNLGNISGSINENERLADISGKLQVYKNTNNVSIILIHHMSKPIGGQTQPGGLGKVRSSQKIVDNSTIVIEVFRDTENPNNETTILQHKDSFGGIVGEIDIKFNKGEYECLGQKPKSNKIIHKEADIDEIF